MCPVIDNCTRLEVKVCDGRGIRCECQSSINLIPYYFNLLSGSGV
jgi:hypothetical protein